MGPGKILPREFVGVRSFHGHANTTKLVDIRNSLDVSSIGMFRVEFPPWSYRSIRTSMRPKSLVDHISPLYKICEEISTT